MNKRTWKHYVFYILSAEAVGGLAAILTREGIARYGKEVVKPPLTPPAIVFPIVWTVLYALMSISAAKISLVSPSASRTRSLVLYWVQLAFNFVWSLLFFNAGVYGFSFVWLGALLILIVWMIACFDKLNRSAAWLQLPYTLWVAFAGYLNYGVWILNR